MRKAEGKMKTVFITGADRGLGFALCEEFLKKDFFVLAGQYMEEWPWLSRLKEAWPGRLELLPLDIGSDESIARAFEAAGSRTAVIDLLIHNAGVAWQEQDMGSEADLEKNLRMFNINSLGPLCLTQRFLPLMEDGMRKVCFVSSEAGSIGVAHRNDMTGYCMSKTALNMAGRILHNDLGKRGYGIYLYHPGWMRTYMEGDEPMKGELEPSQSAEAAFSYFTGEKPSSLQVVDVYGRAWCF